MFEHSYFNNTYFPGRYFLPVKVTYIDDNHASSAWAKRVVASKHTVSSLIRASVGISALASVRMQASAGLNTIVGLPLKSFMHDPNAERRKINHAQVLQVIVLV